MTTATIDRHRPSLLAPRRLPAKGPYARVPYCGEHRTYAKGCDQCRRYFTWHKRIHTLRVTQGERTTVPIAEVRAHLDKLTTAGMTPKMIQKAGPVNRSTLAGLLYKPGRRAVAEPVARRILAIPVPSEPTSPPPPCHITDATGTIRRVQALCRIGWTHRQIAAAAGTTERLEHYTVQKAVTHETAAAIARAYDLLSMTPGPSSRAAKRAARAGWPPPLAWDEATIDDPDARPNLGDTSRTDDYDEITVALAVDGRLTHAQLAAHWPDLLETVRRLATRMTDVEIALHLRWPGYDDGPPGKTRGQNNVGQLRLRNGIPGPAKYEAVHAYPTRRPDAKRRRRAEQAA